MNLGINGKRALVTAGADGIGLAIAMALLEEGAIVRVADIKVSKISELAERLPGLSSTVCDFADMLAIEEMVQTTAADLGGVDILVNNVGIAGPIGSPEEIDVAAFARTLTVNVTSHFATTRAVVPYMRAQRGGSIINISSSVVHNAGPDRSAYIASKHAVVGLTRALAKDLGRHNIRVTAIAPGAVNGPRMEQVIAAQASAAGVSAAEIRAGFVRASSFGVFNEPDDIARAVLFLAGLPGTRISGHLLPLMRTAYDILASVLGRPPSNLAPTRQRISPLLQRKYPNLSQRDLRGEHNRVALSWLVDARGSRYQKEIRE